MTSSDEHRDILDEQIEYYRARASEYDDWFLRIGRYDRGEEATRQWFEEVEVVRREMASVPLDGLEVLELAPGTGIWTEEIVGRARHLSVVEASSEMIELNRQRLGERASSVTYVQANLFDWQPERNFDAVVFCFWISHVPAERIDAFLRSVATMLDAGGWVFFLDSRREGTSTAKDHVLPGDDEEVMTRRLDDGREFSIVKNFWDSRRLEEKCEAAGLEVEVRETGHYFQYGIGRHR